ncbi:efflux RND transporter periplasmic adaptor subunit [Thalassomonas viridans]|uniref:Efflux RND transporter periplasmic adaptor subunit n=1 Tax=Thalassomonas viridans TaxID=137584 RepID=A0AAF0CCL8_9GAMM|nr:efflux RND transporter periplasmic adaptor subunit [Thalassomonas viridans]WDE07995.1 efflux RND transporter periplasmic adaptor subunit [Thalassomonas viridans]
MKPIRYLLISLSLGALVAALPGKTYASGDDSHGHSKEHGSEHKDEHGDGHSDGHDAEEGHVELSPAFAGQAGIKTALATGGVITQTITVYGKTVVEPSRVSRLKARFPGVITELKANIGDKVNAGEALAQIESSDSLTRYTLTAPTSGIVVTRNANPGELADEQVLLTVADHSKLWVEYQVFPGQAQGITSGQTVTVASEYRQAESVIKHLLPGQQGQAFRIARVPLDNSQGLWSSGLLLSGAVVVNEQAFPLVVANRAIQEIEGEQVVFVEHENGFQTRPLVLGESDGKNTRVISGLHTGERYVVENSYLFKAELKKSSAGHHH